MATIQEKAKQAYSEYQKLEAFRKAEKNSKIAARIADTLEDWFDIKIDPKPTTVPFVYDGLEFTGTLDESWAEISFRREGEDLYDEELESGWVLVHSAADIGEALAEDQESRDYIANYKPEDDEASE